MLLLCILFGVATSIPITSDINVASFKEHVSALINNYIIYIECKCKTTYSSTMQEIIVKIRSNVNLAVNDSLNTTVSKICANVN